MFFGDEAPFRKNRRDLSPRNVLRKIFVEDWLMKLIALVITLGLWLGVTGLSTPITARFTAVPLTLRISNNAEITNTPLQEVDVVLKGDKRRIDQINKSDLVVSIDLTDVPAGDRVILLSPDTVSLSLPTGIKLEEVQPNRIAVKIEPVEEKDIPVRVVTEGTLAEGFELYSQTVLPSKVRVRGPASFIKTLDSVITDKIDLAGRNSDFTAKQVALNVSNPKATVLETVADVVFRIGEKRIERLFRVPIAGGEHAAKTATVVLFGPRSAMEALHGSDLRVEMVRGENGEETPQLVLPDALEGRVEIRRLKVTP